MFFCSHITLNVCLQQIKIICRFENNDILKKGLKHFFNMFCTYTKTKLQIHYERNIILISVSLFPPVCHSYDFTPLDSSAVYVLSSMARQRRTSLSSSGAVSPDCDKLERSSSPQSSSSKSNRGHASGTASSATPTKCKRPMNAFMLFAKKYRVEYTQMYPGKDNR